MQKRPNFAPPVQYAPYDLPADFPIGGLIGDTPRTEAVTYLHAHNCLEIGYCFEGAGVFFVDNKVLPFERGDVSVIFRNQIHIAQSEKDNPSRWKFAFLEPDRLLSDIHIRDLSQIIEFTGGDPDFINILTSQQYPEIAGLVSMIILELEEKKPCFESTVRGLVWAFMAKIGRMIRPSNAQEDSTRKSGIVRIAPALDYILKNYMNEIRIKTLAVSCNMSITNFRRIFNSCMGLSPLEYIEKVRIQMASILLSSTDNLILDVALKTGYTSLSSFNRNFKSTTGVSPREWKRGAAKAILQNG